MDAASAIGRQGGTRMKRIFTVAAGAALLAAIGVAPMALAQGAAPHPAHIHAGACPMPGDVVAPLTDIAEVAGEAAGSASAAHVETSTTSVALALTDILAADHAIVVHHSADDMGTYVACGDIGGVVVDGRLAVGLGELGGSGASGIALLTDAGDGTTTVVVYLTDEYGDGAAATATVTTADFSVTAETGTIKVGQPVTFMVSNAGPSVHELVLEKAGDVDVPLEQADGTAAEIEGMAAGAGGELVFTFSEPGTYQLACHIEGHFEAGMFMTFEVTE